MTVQTVEEETLTPAEFRSVVEGFSDEVWLRLHRAAHYFGRIGRTEADDLLQEAYLRCASGERACPRGVEGHTFLTNVMRSLVSALRKSRHRRLEVATDFQGRSADGEVANDFPSDAPNPEDLIIETDAAERLVGQLEQLFADDADAQLVLIGLGQGMTRAEIQSDCTLTDTQYTTIRTRIRRKVDQHFPKGWTHDR